MESQKKSAGLIRRTEVQQLVRARYDIGDEVRVGDTWRLKLEPASNPEFVNITIVKALGDKRFQVRIDRFESRVESEYRGHKVGELLDLDEAYLWPETA